MNIVRRTVGQLLRRFFERQARDRSWGDLARTLASSGDDLAERMHAAPDTPRNREAAQHIVGIERWGQQRLRVGLGEPFVQEGHRPYRLPDDTAMPALAEAFARTRTDTVALARELEANDTDKGLRVRHDDLGDLTLGAWLAYLDGHARREAKRLAG